jgi:carbonic anhydrase
MASPSSPLGLESGTVRLVPYDARWPELFRAESERIRAACGPLPLAFEHIGSTSVPGLWAKPVLDILAGHPAGRSALDYVAPLERAGYVHRGDRGIPGHQFFRRGEPRAYHIHLVEKDGALWSQYVRFREYLRADADAARRYADLKRSLAAQFPRNREAYISGKAAFVLFANNRAWATAQTARDPAFFERLCAIQRPEYLWIGCADSRVPANEIVGLAPGELFVHRNVANLVRPDDRNALAVLQYAVDSLRIAHIIVCGHYQCGGVQAAFGPHTTEPLESWIGRIRELRDAHAAELAALPDDDARWHRLCELNVVAQVHTLSRLPTVVAARARGQQLDIHGWIYDLRDGVLRDLEVDVDGGSSAAPRD